VTVLPRNRADILPHREILVLRRVTLHALHALLERPKSTPS
jgi:hypothetical protein